MTEDHVPIDEHDLHGYVDAQLDAERHRAVSTWLAAHPEDAQRVAAWQADRQALRDAFMHDAAITPHTISPPPARKRITGVSWGQLAACVIASLALGGAVGWRLDRLPIGMASVMRESVTADQAYALDTPDAPAMIAPAQLVAWAGRTLHHSVIPPNLAASGYVLTGGYFMATPYGPGCVFIYRDATRGFLSVFVRPMHGVDTEAAMRPIAGTTNRAGFVWADNGLGVAVIGEGAGLKHLSDTVRQAIRSNI